MSRILVFLTGGLGNQLFQISAAVSVSAGREVLVLPWGNPTSIDGLPESVNLNWPENVRFHKSNKTRTIRLFSYLLRLGATNNKHGKFKLDILVRIFIQLYCFFLGLGFPRVIINQGIGYSPILLESNRSHLLIGYFQSHNYSDKILPTHNHRMLLTSDEPEVRTAIAIHIRLGDYLLEDQFGIPAEEYYLEALKEIPGNGELPITLFTNSPELVRDYFPNLPWDRIVIDLPGSENAVRTLERLSNFQFLIIGNSTFSWWAAYLADKTEMVFYPTPWFKDLPDPEDLSPNLWKPKAAGYTNIEPSKSKEAI